MPVYSPKDKKENFAHHLYVYFIKKNSHTILIECKNVKTNICLVEEMPLKIFLGQSAFENTCKPGAIENSINYCKGNTIRSKCHRKRTY